MSCSEQRREHVRVTVWVENDKGVLATAGFEMSYDSEVQCEPKASSWYFAGNAE